MGILINIKSIDADILICKRKMPFYPIVIPFHSVSGEDLLLPHEICRKGKDSFIGI